ncbi:hypothetical protein PCASD_19092 [Puccinia coronata f. sp. avenae]|uniref:Uncharacterized protein n=1 Tax=Puccinia coronata f. sp. avenae TaxID=200324 RepID=A0A2N5SF54_9BASI|nr:hypothetical protein PCASD_19092 [Puccinia coronata f. sp. avenae]
MLSLAALSILMTHLSHFPTRSSPPPPLLPPPGPASLQPCASPQAPLFLPTPPRGPPETPQSPARCALKPPPDSAGQQHHQAPCRSALAEISLLPSTSQARPAERSQLPPTTSRPQPADCSLLPPTTSRPQPSNRSLLTSTSQPQPANHFLLPPPTGQPQPANRSLLPSTSRPQMTAANCLIHPCRLDHGHQALPAAAAHRLLPAAAAHRLLPAGCRPLLAERSPPTAPCTAGINRSNTAVRAVLEQPCSTGGRTGTVRPKHLPAGWTGLSDQFLGPVAQDQPGPVGQICPTSWLSLWSDSVRPTTGQTRLFEHCSSSRVRPVNAGSAAAAHSLLADHSPPTAPCCPLLADRSPPTSPCCRPLLADHSPPTTPCYPLLADRRRPQPTALSTPAVWATAAKRSLLPASTS